MSAIKPYLEAAEHETDAGEVAQPLIEFQEAQLNGLSGRSATAAEKAEKARVEALTQLRVQHAEMTRTVWLRQAIDDEIKRENISISIAEEGDGELWFQLSKSLRQDIVPWMAGAGEMYHFNMWGEAGKMVAPTWDLPAGSPLTGGSCPGATYGQIIVPEAQRPKLLPRPAPGFKSRAVDLINATCSICYALRGKYPTVGIQIHHQIRFAWIRQMLAEHRSTDLVKTIIDSMMRLRHPLSDGIFPVRIHSSGDLFNQEYAKVWVDVANELYALGGDAQKVQFWMPTRAWAHFDLKPIFSRLKQGNMTVRPSAYHINDPAPGEILPGLGKGATSVRRKDNWEDGDADSDGGPRRYDFDCPVYSEKKADLAARSGTGEKAASSEFTCATVKGLTLDGVKKTHGPCRVCWLNKNLSISYTTH